MTPPSILGPAEIVLNAVDLPRMRAFYTEVLGFAVHSEASLETEVADPDGEPTISFLKICGSDTPLGRGGHPPMLVLIDYRRHVHARSRVVGHDVQRSTLNHLAFEIAPSNFEAHADWLTQNGLELTFAEFPALNARAMFFQDPEGNVLELIADVGGWGR